MIALWLLRLFQKKWTKCPQCGGWGTIDRDGVAVTPDNECSRCGGRGLIRE